MRSLRASVEALREEVGKLRFDVEDLGERLDFAERALLTMRDRLSIPEAAGRDQ